MWCVRAVYACACSVFFLQRSLWHKPSEIRRRLDRIPEVPRMLLAGEEAGEV